MRVRRNTKETELPVRVQIGMTHCSHEADYVSVTIIDERSSCMIVSLKMTPEEFGMAITGRSIETKGFVFQNAPIGRYRETKTEVVGIQSKLSWTEEEKLAALKPFEQYGWTGNMRDIGNQHRSVPKNHVVGGRSDRHYFNVLFERWVDQLPEKADEQQDATGGA